MSGDYTVGATLYHHFSTRAFATGIPTTLIGSPVAEAYEDANATGITAGVSLTIDHAETGHHLLTVVATGGNGFETAKTYGVSLTAGTVGGVSVVGEVIFNFTLGRSAAAVDLANGTDGLGAIKDETALIVADTNEIQGKLPTNKFMGSSDGADDDGTLNTISTNVDDIKTATIMASGVVETSGSNSSTQVQTDLAEASNDHYDVMTIAFTSGAEAGQSRLITGYVGSSGTVSWNAALIGTPADDVTFVILAAGTTADAVWDEALTGASHNIPTSAGKRLRQIEEAFVHASGTIAAVSGGHQVTLDGGAVAAADYYVGDRLQITEGTGLGQSRVIIKYTAGKVVTLDSDWITNPDTNSLYDVVAADIHVAVSDADLAEGFVATATSTTTITLDDTTAIATTDYYVGNLIIFTHGTGAGQSREITGYTSGRVVTMSPALATAVSTDTVWHIQAAPSIAEIADEIWDEALSGHTTAGTSGKLIGDMTFSKANELDVNTKSINDAEVVGDGNSTPWDGA